jgi:hypothetical protein
MIEKLERLAAAGIQILPAEGVQSHFFLERDGFVALVERTEAGFGRIGSPGFMTEKGFAVLVWRNGNPFFVAKGLEQAAAPEQVESMRRFARDLKQALES